MKAAGMACDGGREGLKVSVQQRHDLSEPAAAGTTCLEQGIVAGAARVLADADPRQQVADLRAVHRIVGERSEAVPSIEYPRGKRILQAELALKAGLGMRVGEHPH